MDPLDPLTRCGQVRTRSHRPHLSARHRRTRRPRYAEGLSSPTPEACLPSSITRSHQSDKPLGSGQTIGSPLSKSRRGVPSKRCIQPPVIRCKPGKPRCSTNLAPKRCAHTSICACPHATLRTGYEMVTSRVEIYVRPTGRQTPVEPRGTSSTCRKCQFLTMATTGIRLSPGYHFCKIAGNPSAGSRWRSHPSARKTRINPDFTHTVPGRTDVHSLRTPGTAVMKRGP